MGLLSTHFSRDLLVFLFAVAGGVTLSGITANLYRLAAAKKPESKAGTAIYYAVMAFAGPSVILENATRSYRKDACSNMAYTFAVAIASYWAFVLGMGILTVYGVTR
jgi:hypothetical protein